MNPSWDFDKKNIGLVKVDGKGNFKKFREFFEAFGVDVYVISDLDSIVHGFDKLVSEAAIGEIRNGLLQKIDEKVVGIQSVQIRSRKIKDQIHRATWQEKYLKAKEALKKCIDSKSFDGELANSLDELFKIEEDDKRYKILKDDLAIKLESVMLLDRMRENGICILSKGAIEDYYPSDVPSQESKPKRALLAIQLIKNKEHAVALSQNLKDGRKTELEEIFERIF